MDLSRIIFEIKNMDILNAPVEAVTGGVSQRRLESTEKN